MGIAWRAVELLWREWEGESVVFNVNSGNTHLVNPTVVEVLRMIEKDALTPCEISQRLIATVGGSCDDEIISNVENLLANLDRLGLVEPASQ